METSARLFFEIDSFTPKGKSKISFGELVKKFSAETSLYPDPEFLPYLWTVDTFWFERPSRCLSLYFAISSVYVIAPASAEVFEDLIDHMYHLCKAHNFQGRWAKVAEALQQDLFSRGKSGVLAQLPCNRSDFFGYILPNAYTIIEKAFCIRNKWRPPVAFLSKKQRTVGVKRKIRRRGYNDKGSRRQLHEQSETGPDYSLMEKEKQLEELRSRFDPPRRPKRIFWYNSLDYEGRSKKRSSLVFVKERSETLAERENRVKQKKISTSCSEKGKP